MNIDYSKYWDSSRDDYSNRPDILFQSEHIGYLDDCNKILDLGSGTGILVNKLKQMGKEAVGITYNAGEVNVGVANNLDIKFGDMHNLPFKDSTFDAFVMWDTLEHCVSAYIALCEAKRILREGGKGLIFMPGQNWLDCHCHICCYTVPQMLQLFRQAGLTCKTVYEKKYPNAPERECDGMAIYEVVKDSSFKAVFRA